MAKGQGWLVFRALFVAVYCKAVGCFAFDIFIPGLPQMALSLNAPVGQLQALITAIALGSAVSMLFCGALSDAYGRKKVFLGFMALMTVASFMCCMNVSLNELIFWRFVQGLGSGAPFVLAFAIAADIAMPEKRAVYMVYLSVSLTLFLTVAPVLGGYLTSAFGWHSTFTAVFILAAIGCVLIMTLLPETLKQKSRPDWAHILRDYKQMATNKLFLTLGVTPGIFIGAMVGYASAASHYLMADFGFTNVSYGWYQSSFMIIQSAVGLLLTRFIRRVGVNRALKTGVNLACVASLIYLALLWAMPQAIWVHMAALIVFACTVNLGIVTHIERGMSLYPHAFGTASALQGAVRSCMIGLAVLLSGVLVQGRPMLFLGVFISAMGLLIWGLHRLVVRPALRD